MKEKIGYFIQILYFVMGLVQLAAILNGLEIWWGWPWPLAFLPTLLIAYIPIIGTVVAVMGAVEGGWTLEFSIILFCWPYVFGIVILAIIGVGAVIERLKRIRNKIEK